MSTLRRVLTAVTALALVTVTAYAVGRGVRPGGDDDRPVAAAQRATDASTSATDSSTGGAKGGAKKHEKRARADDRPEQPATPVEATSEPTQAPQSEEPAPPEEPALQPGPTLMADGDQSDDVRDLQARLRQIAWFDHDVTGYYGDITTTAVRGFQAKREIPVTGEVDQRTMDRLLAMTHEPTQAELTNVAESNTPGPLDSRCTSGHVLCIDKTTSTLRWVVDGEVQTTLDVRFGAEYSPTREGAFQVDFKDRDHVSSLYGSAMPYSMFFSGGQAVHYSSDFAARGYAGASHGCVNMRDEDALASLFDQVDVGDPVVVYRS